MNILRTPDDRFDNLPDYDFELNYVDIGGLRMHYADEGSRDDHPILMLHGEPSWSYLYRHMIRSIADAGFRAVVPDLIGFGRSDKPSRQSDYSYLGHVISINRLSLQILEFVLHFTPLVGVIGRICHLGDDRPDFRQFGIEFEVFILLLGQFVFREYSLYRALRLA